MPRRHRKNKTMKRGGMWPFDPTSTSTPTSTPTPSATSSSWWNPFSSNKLSSDGSSSWNPFSSNKPSSSSYSSYGSSPFYGSSSPSQPIQRSSYPPGAPYQEQPDYDQGQTNQDYSQDYSQGQTNQGQTDYNQGQTDYNEQQNAGYRRKRQTKKSSLIKYRTLRPSLNRTGGKTRKMSRRRKH